MQQLDPFSLLPDVVPADLRRRGRPLHGPDEGLIAWDRPTARAVLAGIRGSKVAIAAGYAYYANTADPAPFDGWSVEPLRGEHATSYAERSQALATSKVNQHPDTLSSTVLFAFQFTRQDAAA